MKTRLLCRLTFMLLPLLAGGGCATQALWDGRMDACNEPAAKPSLRVFQDERRNDLLVVYTEYSERRDATRTRAFLLHRNEDRLTEKLEPQFTRIRPTADMREVPVYSKTNAIVANLPGTLCAVVSPDGQEFTLYSGGKASGDYELPTYDDGKGRWVCAALTPVAVGVDTTIVGGVVAYWYLETCGPGGLDFLNRR